MDTISLVKTQSHRGHRETPSVISVPLCLKFCRKTIIAAKLEGKGFDG